MHDLQKFKLIIKSVTWNIWYLNKHFVMLHRLNQDNNHVKCCVWYFSSYFLRKLMYLVIYYWVSCIIGKQFFWRHLLYSVLTWTNMATIHGQYKHRWFSCIMIEVINYDLMLYEKHMEKVLFLPCDSEN